MCTNLSPLNATNTIEKLHFKCVQLLPDGAKLLQGFHQVSLHDTVHQTPDMHHRGGERFVRVIVALLFFFI